MELELVGGAAAANVTAIGVAIKFMLNRIAKLEEKKLDTNIFVQFKDQTEKDISKNCSQYEKILEKMDALKDSIISIQTEIRYIIKNRE